MTGPENSAARHGEAIRAAARRGLWRRFTARLGVNLSARRADAEAALWDRGAAGEAATAELLEGLRPYRWHIRHDLRLPARAPGGTSRANLDHVLLSPCGTTVVVLDTKVWHRGRPTMLQGGRVHCGNEDRHDQVAKVAGYAQRVSEALALPGVQVLPMLVVHGSPIAGGFLEARMEGWPGVVHVLGPDWLVPTLASAPQGTDAAGVFRVAVRVEQVLKPYQ